MSGSVPLPPGLVAAACTIKAAAAIIVSKAVVCSTTHVVYIVMLSESMISGCPQVKTLAMAETEAAAAILGKAERLIKSLAEQRQQQRQREVRPAAACSSLYLLQQAWLYEMAPGLLSLYAHLACVPCCFLICKHVLVASSTVMAGGHWLLLAPPACVLCCPRTRVGVLLAPHSAILVCWWLCVCVSAGCCSSSSCCRQQPDGDSTASASG
jgi:hypothetical protein